jgi:hypothetical protein
MAPRFFSRIARLAAALATLSGCAGDPTAPQAARPDANGDGALLSNLIGVRTLTRKVALKKDITVTAVIGANGGVITVPEAGLTLTVPRGAVASNTKFTVTALAGKLVAYEFGPHGTKFPNALQATQDLKVTNFSLLDGLLPLRAGYFADRTSLDEKNETALVSELLNGVTQPLTGKFNFEIKHFSGYVVWY